MSAPSLLLKSRVGGWVGGGGGGSEYPYRDV